MTVYLIVLLLLDDAVAAADDDDMLLDEIYKYKENCNGCTIQ